MLNKDEIALLKTLATRELAPRPFDDADVLYAVDGGTRVLALPDDNGDGVADRQVQFSPLMSGLAGLAFGQGPPGEVSLPGSFHPAGVQLSGPGLRLTWEDLGPTVPSYNIYEGTIGEYYSHSLRLCTTGGALSAVIVPSPGNRYYLVVPRNDRREGSYGTRSDKSERSQAAAACLTQQAAPCR